MKSSSLCLALLAFAASLAGAQEPTPRKAPKAKVTRADLARAYQRFEKALRAHPEEATKRAADLNRKFDRATVAFFGGAYARAIKALDGLSESLEGHEPVAAGFALRLQPARWERGTPTPRLVLSRIYPTQRPLGKLRLRILNGFGTQVVGERDLVISPQGTLESAPELDLSLQVPGELFFELGTPAGGFVRVGRCSIVPAGFEKQRARLEARLDALEPRLQGTPLAAARASCAARLEHLGAPREDDLASVLLDVNLLARDLEAAVTDLEKKVNPYRSLRGDSWRTLARSERAIPFRVFAPGDAVDSGRPLPVVIAFHGVGGDENMFLYGYGSGELGRQAERLGFLAVTPRSEHFLRDPGALGALLDELSRDYRIDASRVYLLGHSMGTGALTRCLSKSPERIAAAVCFSGGSGTGLVPTLSIRGKLDPFGGMTGRSRPHPQIEARALPDRGHTLLVGEELSGALEWLARHSKPSPEDTKPTPQGKRWF